MLDRVVAFARTLGYKSLVFSNVVDANVFVELAKEKSALQHAELSVAYKADKVRVDVANGSSTQLTWTNLSEYTVNKAGVVN